MHTRATESIYKQLRSSEREPHVQTARRWLKQERKNHHGALCLPLDDDLYLTAKGFALNSGPAPDTLPLVPDNYSLMRLSLRRVARMKDLKKNFERRRLLRDDKILNIATQEDVQYVGALEIPRFLSLLSYATYLFFPFAPPFIFPAIEKRLFRRDRLFRAGPVQKVDPILAEAGCKKGHTATTKQLFEAFLPNK